MKTISFFNEKGGVGKSTYTILYASWLKYKHGLDVAVVDLNSRIGQYRKDEIKYKKGLNIIDQYDLSKAWDIIAPNKEQIKKYKGQAMPLSIWLDEEIRDGMLTGKDVVLIDLPGAAVGKEFSEMLLGQQIGMFAIPTHRNMMTIRATTSTNNTINTYKNYPVTVVNFITQIQTYVKIAVYEELANAFIKMHLQVLPDMISYSERLNTLSNANIIASTLAYPDWDNDAFRGSRDLGLENMFIDITHLLKETRDHRNTADTKLDFVNGLEKVFKAERQLMHSSFPKFDFPEDMFPEQRRKKDTDKK